MSGLTDSHAHVFSDAYGTDLPDVLARAKEAGVVRIIIPATHEASAREALRLTSEHPWLFAAVGIHPHEAGRVGPDEIEAVRQLAATPGVVAIGEIGLDHFYDFAPRDVQAALFQRQMEWAVELDRPVIVHTRDSMDEAVEAATSMAARHPEWCLRDGRAHRGVFHCFTGTEEHARRLFASGFYVSFPGIVTFKKSPVADLIPRLGLERVLIETDSPYLTPVPFRGQRNEPAHVALVANTIAAMLSIPADDVARITSMNAETLFRLPPLSAAS